MFIAFRRTMYAKYDVNSQSGNPVLIKSPSTGTYNHTILLKVGGETVPNGRCS